MTYELKLASGKVAQWDGQDGEDAARRYVDCFRDAVVVAWRYIPYSVGLWNPSARELP